VIFERFTHLPPPSTLFPLRSACPSVGGKKRGEEKEGRVRGEKGKGNLANGYPQDIHLHNEVKFANVSLPLAGVSEAGEKGLTFCQAFFYT